MSRIRKIEIANFRAIKSFAWCPSSGMNCLIGYGDSGKTTIIDAIDLCLGARRNAQFTDADFHKLGVEVPIAIAVTLGELPDHLKSLEAYGNYLRSFNSESGEIDDEPESAGETVLTIKLEINGDLEPNWTLVSERAAAQGLSRGLNWSDRVRLAPTRVGAWAEQNLGWRRGSVLNQLSEERADVSAALAKAARDARAGFGEQAAEQLGKTLEIVTETAKELGVNIGASAKAMLDAHSASFSGGTVSLHDDEGIPLRNLGLGSIRFLIAGCNVRRQLKRASSSSMNWSTA